MSHPVHHVEDMLGVEPPTWKTKKGEILLIRDMSTLHIKKCISMLEENRNKEFLKTYARYINLRAELSLRDGTEEEKDQVSP